MRFAETLNDKVNPEWKAYYINYSELKEMLYDGIAKAPKITNAADIGRYDYRQYVQRFDVTFFKVCALELEKINKFHKEKLREVSLKFHGLKSDAEIVQASDNPEDQQAKMGPKFLRRIGRRGRSAAAEAGLRQAFLDLYIQLVALSKYQELNYTGFRKILKKHDKLFGNTGGIQMLHDKVDNASFHTNKKVEKLLEESELIVTTVFERGSRAKAMKMLRVPQRDDKMNAWTSFKLGVLVGTVLVLVAVFAVSGITDPTKNEWRIMVRFYRGPAVLDLFICLVGVNLYLWKQMGINYVYIFNLDPRDNLVHHHFWNIAAVFGVMWAISVVCFLNAKQIGMPVYASPFALLCIQGLFIFNPFPCLYWSSRKWLIKIMIRVFTAPFHRVAFADFWMADQLASLSSLILDYQFMICFFTNKGVFDITNDFVIDNRTCISVGTHKCSCDSAKNPIRPSIRALPALLRVAQCLRRFYDTPLPWPHLANALKYTVSLMSTTVSALYSAPPSGIERDHLFYIWISISIMSSLYSYYWDVRMDWGLWASRSENRCLRSELLLGQSWIYHVAVVGDFVLRFMWAMSLSLTEMKIVQADIMTTITAPAEIFRRCVWNVFRLENEQINNNNAQRSAHPLPTASITSMEMTEEQQVKDLLNMMDLDNGVDKRRVTPVNIKPSLISFGSNKPADSNTELFTRVDNSTDDDNKSESEFSSNDNGPTKPAGFKAKITNFFCCCRLSKK